MLLAGQQRMQTGRAAVQAMAQRCAAFVCGQHVKENCKGAEEEGKSCKAISAYSISKGPVCETGQHRTPAWRAATQAKVALCAAGCGCQSVCAQKPQEWDSESTGHVGLVICFCLLKFYLGRHCIPKAQRVACLWRENVSYLRDSGTRSNHSERVASAGTTGVLAKHKDSSGLRR